MDYSRPELADRLAADYVAGTLRGPARRRFETLLPAHPVLRRAVQQWQARLLPLTVSVVPKTPPAAVWQRIEARIGGAAPAAARAPRWWQQLAVWRGISALATVAVVSLAVLLASPGPAAPPMVVVLSPATPPQGTPAGGVVPASFVASISGDGRAVVTRPLVNVDVEANRSLELWAVPPSGAPRSLGLISAQASTVVKKGKVPQGTAALAVSLEPSGGSTTGAPTGPILYVGKLTL
jgi:anti-sigma-K factor RskA